MPLPDSFPPAPAVRKRMSVRGPATSAVPTADTPSTRQMIPYTTPLEPVPLPTPDSVPMPSLLGYDAPLFRCHCAPRCIDFVRPRDHPELHWIGSALQPLRTRVVGSGPAAAGRCSKTKTAEFDVDSRVAYEFNQEGFYAEMLSALDANYAALIHTNDRGQAFLHRTREKCPEPMAAVPRTYKPYYPTSTQQAFVPHQPLKDARAVAAQVVAPVIVTEGGDSPSSVAEIEASLRAQAAAIGAAAPTGSLLPTHLREQSHSYRPVAAAAQPLTSSSFAPSASSSRTRLAAERAQFAADMKEKLRQEMTIAPRGAATTQ